MQEIRFHGRGGQGAVIGSEVLAQALFFEGKYVQAFPAFGVERRGAPVTAFCRMDDKPIYLRNQIYRPDHLVVLDASLLQTTGDDFQLFVVNAGAIAVAHRLGSPANPIVNTAILGAFSRATGLVNIAAVEKAIEEYVPLKKKNNRQAAREAYNMVIQG
jgi:pyruvate ferredoxin oxidoreductase gamma subunit/2-oxoisovalerate ferredoxin oxidoreductase gamma subunit